MKELKQQLIKETCNEIKMLQEFSVSSEGYEYVLDGVSKLTDRVVKIEEMERNYEIEMEKINNGKRQFFITTGVGILTFAAGIAMDMVLTNKFTTFEEENVLQGSVARSFVNKIFRK